MGFVAIYGPRIVYLAIAIIRSCVFYAIERFGVGGVVALINRFLTQPQYRFFVVVAPRVYVSLEPLN